MTSKQATATRSMAMATRAIHGGQQVDPVTGAVMPPISLASTYVQSGPGEHQGFEYSRSHNPTRYAYERAVASLEEGRAAFGFASGLAAMASVLDLLPAGSHVIASDDLYGGSYRLLNAVRGPAAGLQVSHVDMRDPQRVRDALRDNTRLIWVETPTNPLLRLADLEAIAALARQAGVMCCADNTFATPVLQRPLTLGFDLVLHSATKYLAGHSDVVSGVVVVGDDPELEERLRFVQNAVGSVAGPFDSYLVLRGIKTLPLRMQRHCENASELAGWLDLQAGVRTVHYPGLPAHPQQALASRQMSAFGGMIAMEIDGGLAAARAFLQATELFQLAESLGGVESLIEHPGIMTHASVPADQRQALGIGDGLIRLSVGIEDVEDLRADLSGALDAARLAN